MSLAPTPEAADPHKTISSILHLGCRPGHKYLELLLIALLVLLVCGFGLLCRVDVFQVTLSLDGSGQLLPNLLHLDWHLHITKGEHEEKTKPTAAGGTQH